MGLFSLLQSRSASEPAVRSPLAAGGAGELWRKTKFVTFSAGEDLQAACARFGEPRLLPSFVVDFLGSCREFREFEAHLARHAERHDLSGLQVEALRSWRPQMVEAGLLLSGEELRRKCAANVSAEAPPPIGAIGFPTGGNRVALLERSLVSFVENAQRHSRTVDFLVADSSADPAQAAQYRERLAQLARERGARIHYIGEPEKRRFASALARRSGCSPEAAEFALLDPLATGFACGANRNALLLHEAGRMLCSVDDDVVCRLSVAPESEARLSSFSECDPFVRRFFPSREKALAAARWRDVDFLAVHEEMLGRGLGAFFGPGEALDLTHVGDDFVARINQPGLHIRTTFTGHVGDPGIPTSVYYLYAEGENRRALPADEAEYRATFASRSVLHCVGNRAVGDASVCPGMAMGLDHRELLPPFFPVLHAEDYIFGATVWQCCGDSIAGHLPVAVLHEPAAGKTIVLPSDLNRDRRAVVFEFAHVLRRLVLTDFVPAEHASAAERTVMLGRHLAERAALPARDFTEFLREEILQHTSGAIDFLEYHLRKADDAPEHWRRDVEGYLDHLREALGFTDFDIPFDLKGARSPAENRALMQTLVRRYGELLQAWPAMVTAAREERERGEPLAVEPA